MSLKEKGHVSSKKYLTKRTQSTYKHTVKAKFHYAIWFEAGSNFEAIVSDQLRTCLRPASNQLA